MKIIYRNTNAKLLKLFICWQTNVSGSNFFFYQYKSRKLNPHTVFLLFSLKSSCYIFPLVPENQRARNTTFKVQVISIKQKHLEKRIKQKHLEKQNTSLTTGQEKTLHIARVHTVLHT